VFILLAHFWYDRRHDPWLYNEMRGPFTWFCAALELVGEATFVFGVLMVVRLLRLLS